MMGRRDDGQGQFFYAFDLDKVVPPDHLVRGLSDARGARGQAMGVRSAWRIGGPRSGSRPCPRQNVAAPVWLMRR